MKETDIKSLKEGDTILKNGASLRFEGRIVSQRFGGTRYRFKSNRKEVHEYTYEQVLNAELIDPIGMTSNEVDWMRVGDVVSDDFRNLVFIAFTQSSDGRIYTFLDASTRCSVTKSKTRLRSTFKLVTPRRMTEEDVDNMEEGFKIRYSDGTDWTYEHIQNISQQYWRFSKYPQEDRTNMYILLDSSELLCECRVQKDIGMGVEEIDNLMYGDIILYEGEVCILEEIRESAIDHAYERLWLFRSMAGKLLTLSTTSLLVNATLLISNKKPADTKDTAEICCSNCKHNDEEGGICEECSLNDGDAHCSCHIVTPCPYCEGMKFEEKDMNDDIDDIARQYHLEDKTKEELITFIRLQLLVVRNLGVDVERERKLRTNELRRYEKAVEINEELTEKHQDHTADLIDEIKKLKDTLRKNTVRTITIKG